MTAGLLRVSEEVLEARGEAGAVVVVPPAIMATVVVLLAIMATEALPD